MLGRRKTRPVRIGKVWIGGDHPVAVQSMTKVPTTDVELCVEQIGRLVRAGCRLVRVAVPRKADTKALAQIVRQVAVPIVADVHFSADRALEAIEAGAAKVRINPGNMDRADLIKVADAAKANGVAVRIGVNEASIRDLREDTPAQQRHGLMVGRLREYVEVVEQRGLGDLVLSAKSSDPVRTITANRAISAAFDYPIHVGLTHAGLPEDAAVSSAVTLGALLSDGIGDTVRVSIAGDPLEEVRLAYEILVALGLAQRTGPQLVVCPTCGRTEVDLLGLARQVRRLIRGVERPIRVAVMGCVVNGPGEAADADLAVCGGRGKAFIYLKGRRIAAAGQDRLEQAIRSALQRL